MYPVAAETEVWEIVGADNKALVPGDAPRTVISISITESGTDGISDVKCGAGNVILRNYVAPAVTLDLALYCENPIRLEKTGSDTAFFAVTYLPYDVRIATYSGILVDFAPKTAIAMQGLSYFLWFGLALLVLAAGVKLGLVWFRR